ncbi:hypothetical protein [Burkholderia metallica]|uniref:hypothetical protein n=1 Tax=Burkholderia metallica TaxID=488729 RepID=UPI001CF279A7|nr:hypothetical protein [Burkholderia metallica]MCA8002741.1 hypothetical protein [Burkholderia metallica]
MSELVQIEPGVVFSSDVLGAEWVRKHGSGDGKTQPANRKRLAVTESDQETRTIEPAQLSLL